MGSSEFEWGALPKSLRNIHKDLDSYIYLDVPLKDKVVTVFCKETQKTDVKEFLITLSAGKMRLKAHSGFDIFINGSKHFEGRTDFWWDIENDLMFWKKNTEFEQKFKKQIKWKEIAK